MAKQEQRRWTDDETEVARRLLKTGACDAEFRRVLGRSLAAARDRIHRIDIDAVLDRASSMERIRVPAEVMAEATRRSSAPITITGFIMGDPPIGYSALDRRNSMQVSQ